MSLEPPLEPALEVSTEPADSPGSPGSPGSPAVVPSTGPAARLAGWWPVVRRVAGWALTSLASLLLVVALVAPNELSRLTLGEFMQVPVEVLLAVALVLVLPPRARPVAAMVVGVAIGLLAIMKLLDIGFFAVLARPFDPVLDWVLLKAAYEFVSESAGRGGAIGAAVAAVALAVALVLLMALSALRLTRLLARHRTTALRVVTVVAAGWIAAALLGVQVVPGVPIAAHHYDRALQVSTSLRDRQAFAAEAAVDAFRDTPGEQLLTALRGKDVIIAFVESYGRDAVEDPDFAPHIGAVLDAGDQRLRAAGLGSQSAFVTAPTVGGTSWLAHATLLSGLWVDNQQRYRTLVASDRLTLNGAFHRAGWRTVAVMPAIWRAWPEGAFYGYDQVYAAADLGYQGPRMNWGIIPDQYTLSFFERAERARADRAPVMAEFALISTHAPWAPIPELVDWDLVGDGSIFDQVTPTGDPAQAVTRSHAETRAAYRGAIEYALASLISYAETYGDDDLVLVFLGDHQPAPIVTGEGASWDVPITIIARDPAVLEQIAGWGWQDGLHPGPQAPVWRMDAFRDQFLTAFGSQPGGP